MQIKINKYVVAGKEWKWGKNDDGYEGVHTFNHELVWYYVYNKPKGFLIKSGLKKKRQSFNHFLGSGPRNSGCPVDVLMDLYEIVIDAIEDFSANLVMNNQPATTEKQE
jgi:hypothetical protein